MTQFLGLGRWGLVFAMFAPLTTAEGAQGGRFAALDAFADVVTLLTRDTEPDSATWQRLFTLPEYSAYLTHGVGQSEFKTRLEVAFRPRYQATRTRIDSIGGPAATLIHHLRESGDSPERLIAYAREATDSALLGRAIQRAQEYLPDTVSTDRIPTILVAVFEPDGYGTPEHILVDPLFFHTTPDPVGFLAHELHHVFFGRIVGPDRVLEGDAARGLARAVRAIQSEGIADLINKDAIANGAQDDWYARTFRERLGDAPSDLAAVDSLLAEFAAMPEHAERLGKAIWDHLAMGAHPVGYEMARRIRANAGREGIIATLEAPVSFFEAYNTAVGRPVFSPEALEAVRALSRSGR